MAYWWVSQNQTWKKEFAGSYLWAPDANRAGSIPFHWATMRQVQPGDIIFSYVGQKILALSTAKTTAYNSPKPFTGKQWQTSGWRIDVVYSRLDQPLKIPPIARQLRQVLPEKRSPIKSDLKGYVGYLFAVPPEAGHFLIEQIDHERMGQDVAAVERSLKETIHDTTVREAIVQSRIGQGKFRQDLQGLNQSRCCVTACSDLRLLRASHIKPWKDSDNRERTDSDNGLLLTAAYDAAFDAGLISFRDNGTVLVSTEADPGQLRLAGVSVDAVATLRPQNLPYLSYHRDHCLRQQRKP